MRRRDRESVCHPFPSLSLLGAGMALLLETSVRRPAAERARGFDRRLFSLPSTCLIRWRHFGGGPTG